MAKNRSVAVDAVRAILLIIVNITVYALILIAAVKFCRFAYSFSYQVFGEVVSEKPPGNTVTFEVKKGEDVMTLSKRLEERKLVVNAYSFYIRAKLTLDDKHVLEPGKYVLSTSMTYDEIMEQIIKSEKS